MVRPIFVVSGFLALAAAWLATLAIGRDASRPGQLVPYEDAAAVALGEALYADYCASCHGADLEGQGANWRERGPDGRLPAPPHDETGHTWHHADALLVDITTRGTEAIVGPGYDSAMIGFGDVLSEDEILAVLAFIKSTWPDEIIEIHNRVNADAERYAN